MNMNLEKIYQQTILEYSGRKDVKKEIESPSFVERGHNPSCGDDLTLLVKLNGEIIEDASYIGNGCAISSASSAMLVDLIKGKTIDEAKEKVDLFFKMMSFGDEEKLTNEESKKIGDAILMEYVSKMPARVKCATLTWHSLKVILEKKM